MDLGRLVIAIAGSPCPVLGYRCPGPAQNKKDLNLKKIKHL